MNKFLASFIGFIVSLTLTITVMIYGWGLTPVSWGWIIWGSIGSSLIGAFIMAMSE